MMNDVAIAVKRIIEMESILDEALNSMDNVDEDPDALLEYRSEIERLDEYYHGQEWREDFALDEAGLLPKDLKRGVLSEDGIFDALERYRELLEEID